MLSRENDARNSTSRPQKEISAKARDALHAFTESLARAFLRMSTCVFEYTAGSWMFVNAHERTPARVCPATFTRIHVTRNNRVPKRATERTIISSAFRKISLRKYPSLLVASRMRSIEQDIWTVRSTRRRSFAFAPVFVFGTRRGYEARGETTPK
jgi:hypothetical protein